ncbi:PWWP domain-containing protein 2A-like [Mizuhopecten yessoensis]|uniref:PWWP domain-containing protein 2A n=1 Tax=Mizuhopecten yessoensis TaxID=6573 RepID=A0A210PX17_MIZYE|nr:PWWP domain-containing protein 2A-like [Mizuhopecten yessoensis]XP_021372974.1 PWWP domain-containing protein 2A-like [Mizuhopecten yessoensis]OWF41048.1 PWWP domain-containing protein 2A [Mizuhopecten yessoensis]
MKMAEQKRRNGLLSKGMKLPVTIEEALNDVLVVSLETGSKVFRGILLDMKKRNLPHGVPWQFDQSGSNNGKDAQHVAEGDTSSQPELAATSNRYTYQEGSSQNNRQPPPHPVALTRALYKDKNVRRIRLRPRQTLCNKCKAVCTETDKGIVPVTAVTKQQKPTPVHQPSPTPITRRPLKEGLRKRTATQASSQPETYPSRRKSLIQSKPVAARISSRTVLTRSESLPVSRVVLSRRVSLTESKTVSARRESSSELGTMLSSRDSLPESRIVLTRRESLTDKIVSSRKDSTSESKVVTSRRDSNPEAKPLPLRKDSNGETKLLTTVVNDNKIQKLDKSAANTKASPLIKITIGEGTVIKIPPRIHGDEVDGEGQSPTKVQETDSNDQTSSSEEMWPYKKPKKAFKKPKDKKDSENNSSAMQMSYLVSSHHKKHKRKHRHRHGSHSNDSDVFQPEGDMLDMFDENGETHSETTQTEVISQRPRLLYTWRQNKGLSPRRDVNKGLSPRRDINKGLSPRQENTSFSNIDRSMSPKIQSNESVQVQKKEYRLRSRERNSTESESVDSMITDESDDSCDDNDLIADGFTVQTVPDSEDDQSAKSEGCSGTEEEEGPPGDTNIESLRPLMMKIQTHDVTKCVATDGRSIHVGDIVWGKIQGFPWWPGRVLSITVSQRDNGIMIRQLAHVSWFGSSTMSHIQCSDLYPFLEDFKLRFNRKKRGPYKMAIKQATIAAQSITNTHHIDFTEFDL